MLVLVTYDVETITSEGSKRLRKVAKECTNFGQRVQNSVFECVLSEAQFTLLRSKIEAIIDNKSDSIRFYFLGKNWHRHIISLGKKTSYNIDSTLII